MSFYEGDPHPSPPHKGEGTLPHATLFGAEPRRFAGSALPSLPPPYGGGIKGGGIRKAQTLCDCPAVNGEKGLTAMAGFMRLS